MARHSNNIRVAVPDRLPPHSAEAEQGVIGCMLSAPDQCVDLCMQRFGSTPQAFYDLRHQVLFQALCELRNELKPVDIITLQQHLKDKGELEQIGGIPYLIQLQEAIPSAANLPTYADLVQDKFTLRRILAACAATEQKIYANGKDASELLSEAEREILSVRPMRSERNSSMAEVALAAMEGIENRFGQKGKLRGLPTGLHDLDRLTGGLRAKQLTVCGGFTSQGKSSLARNIAAHLAVVSGIACGIFSLEMGAEEITEQMIFSHARVDSHRVDTGEAGEEELKLVVAAAAVLRRAPLFIDDTSDLAIEELRAKARRWVHNDGVKLIIVDYLQLLNLGKRHRDDNREQEVSEIAKGLKQCAKELGVPVFVLTQLNEDGKIRESRAVGMHADNVWKLAKDKKGELPLDARVIPMNLLIQKQRGAPTGVIKLTYHKTTTRFETTSNEVEEPEPEQFPHG